MPLTVTVISNGLAIRCNWKLYGKNDRGLKPRSRGRDNCKDFSFAATEDPPLLASVYLVS